MAVQRPGRQREPKFMKKLTLTLFDQLTSVFTANDYFFWIPIIGPFTGGAVAAGIYKVLDWLRS